MSRVNSERADGLEPAEETPSEPRKRRNGGNPRRQAVGPANKTVPNLRKAVGSSAAPALPVGPIAPIRVGEAKPLAHPVGPARAEQAASIRPPAARATVRRRHRLTLYTFLLFVLLPVALLAGYLGSFAQDQYASEAGFSVRKEEGGGSVDMIGGLTQLTGSASTDAEILYDYIRSPDLVADIDRDLDLYGIYSRNYDDDPLFSLAENSTIEQKTDYWRRMVTVEYNEATGLIRLEVRAFTAEEAQAVGRAVIDYSSQMINRLSNAAREDATRYARAELEKAVEQLKTTRAAVTEFRSRTQIIDPLEDIKRQSLRLNNLEAQLTDAMIQLDTLRATVTVARSPQIEQTELRISIIQKQIEEERAKIGLGPDGNDANTGYAQRVAEYERLVVDREVAEERFRATTMLYSAAQAEADRKSRYLAAHVEPTLAEGALYPHVTLILLMTGGFLVLIWALMILIYYSIRDRR
jgi:capsular polysaccharide transport system permease protein